MQVESNSRPVGHAFDRRLGELAAGVIDARTEWRRRWNMEGMMLMILEGTNYHLRYGVRTPGAGGRCEAATIRALGAPSHATTL